MLLNEKSALASRTIWGGLLSAGAGALQMGGLIPDGSAEEVAELGNQAVEIAFSLMSFIGGVIAIYGRIVATRKIQ